MSATRWKVRRHFTFATPQLPRPVLRQRLDSDVLALRVTLAAIDVAQHDNAAQIAKFRALEATQRADGHITQADKTHLALTALETAHRRVAEALSLNDRIGATR